jgi:hypothetical protein
MDNVDPQDTASAELALDLRSTDTASGAPGSPEFEQTATHMAREFAEVKAEVTRLMHALQAATKRLDDAFRRKADGDDYFRRFEIGLTYDGDRSISLPDLHKAMERKAWDIIVDRLGIKNVMSVAMRKAFEEQLAKGALPPLGEHTIVALLLGLTQQAGRFAKEAAKEVFDILRPRGPTGIKYATNNAARVGRRVILPWTVEAQWSGKGFRVRYGYEQTLTAIDGVFHMLDGQGVMRENRGPLVKAINETDSTGRAETDYFKVRCCKNRNLHIEFKRLDLVKELNYQAVGERVLGEDVD